MNADNEQMMQMISRNTVRARIMDWIDNFKANLPRVHGGYGIASMLACFGGKVPCIIVGSGPTLDWNIKDLKDVGNRACILCCDSATKALLKEGIRPHIVVTTDSKGRVADFIDGCDGLNFVVDTFVHPRTIEAIEKNENSRVYFYNTMDVEMCPFTSHLNDKTGFIGNLGTGGCVATTAWFLAVAFLTAEPDILVGLPESFYDPGRMYATVVENTVSTEPYQTIPDMVEDIHGRTCYTYPALLSFAHWFHDSFKRIPTVHINASEGGILKDHILNMPLRHVVDKYLTKEYDIEGMLFAKEIQAQGIIDRVLASQPAGVDLPFDIQAEKPLMTILLDGPSLMNLALRMGSEVNEVKNRVERLRGLGLNIDEGVTQQGTEDGVVNVPTFQLIGLQGDIEQPNEREVIEVTLPSAQVGQVGQETTQLVGAKPVDQETEVAEPDDNRVQINTVLREVIGARNNVEEEKSSCSDMCEGGQQGSEG